MSRATVAAKAGWEWMEACGCCLPFPYCLNFPYSLSMADVECGANLRHRKGRQCSRRVEILRACTGMHRGGAGGKVLCDERGN
eukprot:5940694-Alexandrium_andersonii.AAC.2